MSFSAFLNNKWLITLLQHQRYLLVPPTLPSFANPSTSRLPHRYPCRLHQQPPHHPPATLGYPTSVTPLPTLIQTRTRPSIPTLAPYPFHSKYGKSYVRQMSVCQQHAAYACDYDVSGNNQKAVNGFYHKRRQDSRFLLLHQNSASYCFLHGRYSVSGLTGYAPGTSLIGVSPVLRKNACFVGVIRCWA